MKRENWIFSLKFFLVFSLVLFDSTRTEDAYTSLTQMEHLLRLELQLKDLFGRYMKVAPAEKRQPLMVFRNELRSRIGEVTKETIPQHIQHPVHAFLLLHRFATSWRQLMKIVNETKIPEGSPNKGQAKAEQALLSTLLTHEVMFPKPVDLAGAAEAIYRLQQTYLIPARVFASGTLSPNTRHLPLSIEDCFNLALIAHTRSRWSQSEAWFKETLERYKGDSKKRAISKVDILEYLAWSQFKLGKLSEALDNIKEILEIEPNHDSAKKNLVHFDEVRKEILVDPSKSPYKKKTKRFQYDIYERICRGDTNKTSAQEADHICRYISPHPRFILKPVKIEYANRNPDIVIYKQIISDSEIERIKELAKHRLKRATVICPETGYLVYAQYRVSKSMWLNDREEEFLEDITERLEDITGLDLTTAEDLQVVNYGIGGQYEPHWDHATKYDKKPTIYLRGTGNRIATILFYMTNVESGGGTAFVHAETLLKPSKGDAAMWYNLYMSGEGDDRTRHAGCPVIVGSKWVSNRWVHEIGQELRKPCGLGANDTRVI